MELNTLLSPKVVKNETRRAKGQTRTKKLKSSGIPKCEIKNITGHTSA